MTNGSWDAISKLTLMLMPNLQELEFQGWCYESYYATPEESHPLLTQLF